MYLVLRPGFANLSPAFSGLRRLIWRGKDLLE